MTHSVAIPPASAKGFYFLTAIGALVSALGFAAVIYMEHHGHQVTGMNNQFVWGLPLVFAFFQLVAGSGALNVGLIGPVFGKQVYKPFAPLAGLLALALLAGGVLVILLDLGRPDRVPVALTHMNLTSVFGWDVILFNGFFAIVILFLWTQMSPAMRRYSQTAGLLALVWRFILTTGTGSIFGFLVARQAYQSAIVAPMFIIFSFAWGMAVFLVVQRALLRSAGATLHPDIARRMGNLLGIFIVAAFYFVLVYHLTNLYYARQTAFEEFILVSGGVFPKLFWGGYIALGTVLPLLLLYVPAFQRIQGSDLIAAVLTLLGGLALMYVFIVGAQAFPLEIFPGMQVKSSFLDGQIDHYVPSTAEVLLSFGGFGISLVITLIALRVLPFKLLDDNAPLAADPLHD